MGSGTESAWSKTCWVQGKGWRSTAYPSIREVVTKITAKAEDLEWTIQRLSDLAKEQKSSELTRVLKQSVWSPAATAVEEPQISRRKEAGKEQEASS